MARTPAEVIVGLPQAENSTASFAYKQYKSLERAFSLARDSIGRNQMRSKDLYDRGIVARVFQVGDHVRIHLKNLHFKPGSKLHSNWSGLHEVVDTKEVFNQGSVIS